LIESVPGFILLVMADEPPVEACPLSEPVAESAGEYWRWCPRCGHELHNEKCKLRCPRCHYFMSCSDFDA
jgi:Zn finger protein HypA/HybF involved in hydrogenase expression